jgi:hypothetical protein
MIFANFAATQHGGTHAHVHITVVGPPGVYPFIMRAAPDTRLQCALLCDTRAKIRSEITVHLLPDEPENAARKEMIFKVQRNYFPFFSGPGVPRSASQNPNKICRGGDHEPSHTRIDRASLRGCHSGDH